MSKTTNNSFLYWYKAKVVSVYDADTIRADIDLGFSIVMRNEPRIAEIYHEESSRSINEQLVDQGFAVRAEY